MTPALPSVVRSPAAGAVLGQVTQVLGGLVLQVAAARSLGATGLATFSLAYGVLVLATAVVSGLVGDSLTVLDRADRAIRAGLHVWTALLAGAGAVLGAGGALLSGALPVWAGLLVGPAVAVFLVEDTMRRMLMAGGRFWSLPAVDGAALVTSLAVLGAAASGGGVDLADLVTALLAGQAAGSLVAWRLLAPAERPRGPWRAPALGAVWSFGVWRALAQTIRPALLTGLRLLVVGVLGAAAYGPVEAARVLTSPTLVVVGGLGSFLLPHFVRLQDAPPGTVLRRADRAVLALVGGVAAIGVLVVALLPWAGPLLTGGGYEVPVASVAGWSAYAVASAALLPYSSLAAVHRRQRQVLALRGLEFLSLAVALLLVLVADGGAAWTPWALCIGPLLAAAAVRRRVLVRALADGPDAAADPVPAATPA
ncbi:hypothetical protein [Blastococcus sp. SYSU D00695]